MEITGKIKKIDETKTFGASGFRKREMVVTTNEQYPQMLMVEFVQDKCDLLNNYQVDQDVKVSINLRGREWINPEGVAKYFNAVQGWRIELLNSLEPTSEKLPEVESVSFIEDPDNDLPF